MSYRYIGNKLRLLPWLMPIIRDIVKPGAVVADLMCGTATVSEALRLAGYKVVAADIMTFAVYHAHVRLTIDKNPLFPSLCRGSYYDILWELQNLEPINGYMVREYSPSGQPMDCTIPRNYFTTENAGKIDAIQKHIRCWEQEGLLTAQEVILLRHDLVLAANRVANIAGTYGHYRSSWSKGSLRPLVLTPTKFISGYSTDHIVLKGYAEELAPKISADLCYLDPPYMKRQYAANYHLIETIARGDEPPAIGVSGLRPWRDQYSNFCSKIKIRDSFTAIISGSDCPQFLISYSEDGLLSLDDLKQFLSQFGTITVRKYAYPRFRSNNSSLGANVIEYLFHLVKDK